jgi:hypothetical protein
MHYSCAEENLPNFLIGTSKNDLCAEKNSLNVFLDGCTMYDTLISKHCQKF